MNGRTPRAARVLGWSLVVLGAGHLATVAAAAAAEPDRVTRVALDGLSRVPVAMPGPAHTLDQLFQGYSLLMGLMVVAVGGMVLVVVRHAEESARLLRSVLWLGGAVAAVGLILSVALMPAPPVVGMAVALAAAGVGLTARDGVTA